VTEWRASLQRIIPGILQGLRSGYDDLGRCAEVRLGVLVPVVPVVLDYLGAREPYPGLILDAFAAEPGDTLWHFVNEFSRAANLVLEASGVSLEVALAKRRVLQQYSLEVCETFLDRLSRGHGLLRIAEDLKGSLSTALN
jgi:hypothetical protein